jgi:hypothetical protein
MLYFFFVLYKVDEINIIVLDMSNGLKLLCNLTGSRYECYKLRKFYSDQMRYFPAGPDNAMSHQW